jgi:hypothetical protein
MIRFNMKFSCKHPIDVGPRAHAFDTGDMQGHVLLPVCASC